MAHESYLTYSEYTALGGTLPQTAFPILEHTARKRIDFVTDSRVQGMATIPNAVKLCMVALINMGAAISVEAQADKPVVTSFSTDGYSESYAGAITVDTADIALNKVVSEYLYGEVDDDGTPLLYRGVR